MLPQDVRYGLRMLRKSPGFAAVALLILALGIGANSAIFSVVHAVLLRPLPFPESERLVEVAHVPPPEQFPGRKTFAVSPANYLDWRAQNDVFENMTVLTGTDLNLTGGGAPESLPAAAVSADFFSVLRVAPTLGRGFAEGEDQRGGAKVAVLSQALWKSRFGGNPGAIGQAVVLDGQPYTVIGVMPARFAFPDLARLWVPLAWTDAERSVRGIHDFEVIARLKPGVPLQRARAQMSAISERLARQYPADDKGWGAVVTPLREDLVGDVRPALLVLLGAVAFVLLISCANVANLVLAKTLGRRKEIAVRTALGATRGRVLRQMFVEATLIAVGGGALGLTLAGSGVRLIMGLFGDRLPRAAEIHVDATVLAFTLGISLCTGLLAGLAPAWRLTSSNLNDALKQGLGRTDADTSGGRTRAALVVVEVALALVLMTGAGLMVRSVGRLRDVDPGFDPRHVLKMILSIPDAKYATPEQKVGFYARGIERLRALPGVDSAGVISSLPLSGGSTQPIAIEGRPVVPLSEQPEIAVRVISPGLLRSLRVRLLRGRDFSEADRADGRPVVLASESMARQFWPGQDPIGKRLILSFFPGVTREVVGVVADVKLRELRTAEPVAATYVPLAQMPRNGMAVVVRTTSSSPGALAPAAVRAVHGVDPDEPIGEIQTMEDFLGDSISPQRFNMLLLAAFASLALVLAAVGIYSVLSYSVKRRSREIGIRMALGAQWTDVLRMVVAQGMRPALLGLAIGVAASLALSRALTSLLFGVSATDPPTLIVVSGLLALVALAACAVPAHRATRVQPTEALQDS